jgi:tRNA U34 5-methylaminomethyl-2-thiouridine-forming methyltransferase MnmC
LYAADHDLQIEYHGLEAFPLPEAILNQVNYSKVISDPRVETAFQELHSAPWNMKFQWMERIEMLKIIGELQEYSSEELFFDVIYFDAFGPRAQEEMWDIQLLEKLYKSMKKGGILVTYCAKGSFKRDLKAIGFTVESIPGPPGKREMTRAIK